MTHVELLRELLRANTVNPPGEEEKAAAILEAYRSSSGRKTGMLESPGARTSLVARLESPTDRPALVLLSHSDVVPVEEDSWTRDPFGADLADGVIWGRGALDMKSIAVMHAVAAAELAGSGREPTREVIVVMAADEESGGAEGAEWLRKGHGPTLGIAEGGPPPRGGRQGAYGI